MERPDDRHAELPQLPGQAVDWLNDAAGGRHLGGCAGRAEHLLHVDDDQRRAPRVEFVEPVVPSTAGENAIDDFLPDGDLVHLFLDQKDRPSENTHRTRVSVATAFSHECGISEWKCRYSSGPRS